MKKLLCFVATAILCGSAAFAQSTIVSSRSTSIKTTETPSETQWILRAGANFAGVRGDDADDLDRKTSYDVSLSFQKPLSDFGMFWGMEFGLGSRGFSYEDVDRDGDWGEKISLLAHNVRYSPFTIGYAYPINESLKVDVRLGAYASFDYLGKWKESELDWDEWDEDEWDLSDIEDYNRFDYGLNFGIGVWYDRYNLDLSWQRGFNEAIKDVKCYTNNIMLRVGIAF